MALYSSTMNAGVGELMKSKEIGKTNDSLCPGSRPVRHYAKINSPSSAAGFPKRVYFRRWQQLFDTLLHFGLDL